MQHNIRQWLAICETVAILITRSENLLEKKFLGDPTFLSSPLKTSLHSAINFGTETKCCRQKRFPLLYALIGLTGWLHINSFTLFISPTKRNRDICMFHWLLVAPQALKSVLPVEESLSNKEMRTCSRILAHQSTSETINITLWRRKTKPPLSQYTRIAILNLSWLSGNFLSQFCLLLFCFLEPLYCIYSILVKVSIPLSSVHVYLLISLAIGLSYFHQKNGG